MTRRSLILSLATFALAILPAMPPLTARFHTEDPLAGLEEYRRPAGVWRGDTLDVALDVRAVRWRPEGDRDGSAELPALAFVERGQAPRVPGPMLRMPSGTTVRVALRNGTAVRLVVFGLQRRGPGATPDSTVIAPGADASVTFRAGAPGTYYYWGRQRTEATLPPPPPDPALAARAERNRWVPGGIGSAPVEGPLAGALIVDPAGTTPPPGERVLMLTRWYDPQYLGPNGGGIWKTMVNGASWPATERLVYTVGDTVRWRVINAMAVYHPMHLHGFYFDVTSRGDAVLDTVYARGGRRKMVTELMAGGSTMALTWVPDRPGNWLFHCHLLNHMRLSQRIGPPRPASESTQVVVAHHAARPDGAAVHRAEDHMAGLVVGVLVTPRPGSAAAALERATGAGPARRGERALRLVATTRPRVYGDAPAFSFVLQEGAAPPAADSTRLPGSLIVLTRGEPTRITVVNGIGTPLAVHWHGLEIESWYDGVGGWSGAGTSVRPPIAAGDSFAVRMTPRRAGTFIYHSHDETGQELASGLYAPLLVLEPGTRRDPTRDHLLVLGLRGPGREPPLAVNGRIEPDTLVLRPGVAHRLRFVSIPANERVEVALVRGDSAVQTWTPLARDGADVPRARRGAEQAQARFSAGQTLDVGVQFAGDDRNAPYALRLRTTYYANPRVVSTIIPIVMR